MIKTQMRFPKLMDPLKGNILFRLLRDKQVDPVILSQKDNAGLAFP